jgi:hypothetical protein
MLIDWRMPSRRHRAGSNLASGGSIMSNVLEFRVANASCSPRSSAAALDAPAKIVFFPGIRYERVTEPVDPPPTPRAKPRTRRRSRQET